MTFPALIVLLAAAHRKGSPGVYSGFLATSSTNSEA